MCKVHDDSMATYRVDLEDITVSGIPYWYTPSFDCTCAIPSNAFQAKRLMAGVAKAEKKTKSKAYYANGWTVPCHGRLRTNIVISVGVFVNYTVSGEFSTPHIDIAIAYCREQPQRTIGRALVRGIPCWTYRNAGWHLIE